MVILILWLSATVSLVQAEESTCAVRYLSAEHVYLDSGSNDGLVVGSKVRLMRGGKAFAELEVVYAAGYSASCLVMDQPVEFPRLGRLPRLEYSKEELLEIWKKLHTDGGLDIRVGVRVTAECTRRGPGQGFLP